MGEGVSKSVAGEGVSSTAAGKGVSSTAAGKGVSSTAAGEGVRKRIAAPFRLTVPGVLILYFELITEMCNDKFL